MNRYEVVFKHECKAKDDLSAGELFAEYLEFGAKEAICTVKNLDDKTERIIDLDEELFSRDFNIEE